ncbi:MAG: AI-2E family transporter, partial [Proteobacteria bacterium]|nr:AI-2E family transporter [Pseudomonadota bacterium]
MDKQQRRALVLTALILGGAVLFLHAVSEILLPFVVGLVLAYLLNPAVTALENRGVHRGLASAIPVSAAVSLIVILLVLGIPLLMEQMTAFAQRLPAYLNALEQLVLPNRVARSLQIKLTMESVLRPLGMMGAQGAEWTAQALQRMISGVAWLVNIILLTVMTPLVAFYLLVDWPALTDNSLKQLPRPWRTPLRTMMVEIDLKLAAYLRGTMAVCLSIGIFYAVGLALLGPVLSWLMGTTIPTLELGWVIGLMTGIFSFVPIIGSAVGFITMMIVALMQYQLQVVEPYIFILLLFIIGQSLENYILNPLLVGKRVGLHPLWVIFALMAGG